jgi:hypothetical protein
MPAVTILPSSTIQYGKQQMMMELVRHWRSGTGKK